MSTLRWSRRRLISVIAITLTTGTVALVPGTATATTTTTTTTTATGATAAPALRPDSGNILSTRVSGSMSMLRRFRSCRPR